MEHLGKSKLLKGPNLRGSCHSAHCLVIFRLLLLLLHISEFTPVPSLSGGYQQTERHAHVQWFQHSGVDDSPTRWLLSKRPPRTKPTAASFVCGAMRTMRTPIPGVHSISKLLGTNASLLGARALLVVTRSLLVAKGIY